jgi:hypothetical protein
MFIYSYWLKKKIYQTSFAILKSSLLKLSLKQYKKINRKAVGIACPSVQAGMLWLFKETDENKKYPTNFGNPIIILNYATS